MSGILLGEANTSVGLVYKAFGILSKIGEVKMLTYAFLFGINIGKNKKSGKE